jgi:hypothetical protein
MATTSIETQISVKTSEGDIFNVGLSKIQQSNTFHQMYRDLNLAEGDPFEFPIPAVKSAIFKKTLEWMDEHVGEILSE